MNRREAINTYATRYEGRPCNKTISGYELKMPPPAPGVDFVTRMRMAQKIHVIRLCDCTTRYTCNGHCVECEARRYNKRYHNSPEFRWQRSMTAALYRARSKLLLAAFFNSLEDFLRAGADRDLSPPEELPQSKVFYPIIGFDEGARP